MTHAAAPENLLTWCARTPAATALIDATTGGTLTYAQLDEHARRLAADLRRAGARAGDCVALLAEGSPDVLVLWAACAHLGATFMPVNWRLGASELLAIFADARPRLLLCDTTNAELAATTARATGLSDGVMVARDLWLHAGGDAHAPHEAALLLYTSGTTGRPRGVMLGWEQLAFNARVTAARLALGARDRTLAVLPLFHTGGLNCLTTPVLAAGGTVVLLPRFDAARASRALERFAITSLIAVPSVYERLLEQGLHARRAPALRHLLVGGAPAQAALFDACRERGLPLLHGYGMTEVGPNCFTFGDGPGSIGRPMPGTRARIVLSGGEDASPGDVGELWLSGPHVCRGYFASPARRSPWFPTGDLARENADGTFAIAGRLKDMYISGGENVYPAEVETVLAAHPAVAEAAVLGVPDARWGEVGLAAVVTRTGRTLDPAELARWVRERLAGYKVPRHVRLLPSLPRNATGKVEKAALRELCRMPPGAAAP